MSSGDFGNLNGDEFDTMFELIIAIIFLSFGVFSMSLMARNMSERAALNEEPDKIEMTMRDHEDTDPFYFTGYQAYMFSWHMDEMSDVPLSYVGGLNIPSTAHVDGSDTNHVTLSVKDNNGDTRSQFLVWRNQMITGQGYGATLNVKKTINSLTTGQDNLYQLYRGLYSNGTGKIAYHLELTDKYKLSDDLGSSLNYGGKKFEWVLAPCYH